VLNTINFFGKLNTNLYIDDKSLGCKENFIIKILSNLIKLVQGNLNL
jgi:hypothetical protein